MMSVSCTKYLAVRLKIILTSSGLHIDCRLVNLYYLFFYYTNTNIFSLGKTVGYKNKQRAGAIIVQRRKRGKTPNYKNTSLAEEEKRW